MKKNSIIRVFAAALATLIILTTLPIVTLAESWASATVDNKQVETTPEGTITTTDVTFAIDPAALKEYVSGGSIKALLKGITVSGVKNAFTVSELFEIIPQSDWADLINYLIDEVGLDNVLSLGGFDIIDLINMDYIENVLTYENLFNTYVDKSMAIDIIRGKMQSDSSFNIESCLNDGGLKALLDQVNFATIQDYIDVPAFINLIKTMSSSELQTYFNASKTVEVLLANGYTIDTLLTYLTFTSVDMTSAYNNDVVSQAQVLYINNNSLTDAQAMQYLVDNGVTFASLYPYIVNANLDISGLLTSIASSANATTIFNALQSNNAANIESLIFGTSPKYTLAQLDANGVLDITTLAFGDSGKNALFTTAQIVAQVNVTRLLNVIGVDALFGCVNTSALISGCGVTNLINIPSVISTLRGMITGGQLGEIIDLVKTIDYTSPEFIGKLTKLLNDILNNVTDISLYNNSIASSDDLGVLSLNAKNALYAVRDLLLQLKEITNIPDDGTVLAFPISFTYQAVDANGIPTGEINTRVYNVSFKLLSGADKVSAAATKILNFLAQYISFDVSGSKVTLAVTLPSKVTSLLNTVLASDYTTVKDFIYNIYGYTPADIPSTIEGLTMEDAVKLLNKVGPEKITAAYQRIMQNAYVDTVLGYIQKVTNVDVSSLTLDDFVVKATDLPTVGQIVDKVESKLHVSISSMIDLSSIETLDFIDIAEKIVAKYAHKDIDVKSILEIAAADDHPFDKLYEMVVDKIASEEYYFNVARSYLIRIFNKLLSTSYGQAIKDKKFGDLYKGDTAFHFEGSLTINPKALADKAIALAEKRINIPEKVKTIIYTFIKDGSFQVSADLTLNATNIYKVSFYNADGSYIKSMFLPTGASILNALKLEDATFLGWADKANTETQYTSMPAKDIDLIAVMSDSVANYTVKHFVETKQQNGTYAYELKDTENLSGVIGSEVTVTLKTYTHCTATVAEVKGTVLADGSLVLNVYYDIDTYTITFDPDGGTATGTVALEQIVKYGESAVDPSATLTKTNFKFAGFDSTAWQNVTANATIKALWSNSAYTITYNLNGGTVDGTNLTAYDSVLTQGFTLINPTKAGYTFKGWTGTGLTSATTTVTIANGSEGNRTYTATWEAISYTITYSLNGGTVSGNPTTYTIESSKITLVNPSKVGYTFKGWTGTDLTSASTSVSIAQGSTGNRTYTATWELNTYTITYNLDGGHINGTNPTTYTIESNDFTFIEPAKDGYAFAGWIVNGTGAAQKNYKVTKGSTGNISLKATYGAVKYTITSVGYGLSTIPTEAAAGATIKVTVTQEIGVVKTIVVKTIPDNQVINVNADGSFTMPTSNVIVTVTTAPAIVKYTDANGTTTNKNYNEKVTVTVNVASNQDVKVPDSWSVAKIDQNEDGSYVYTYVFNIVEDTVYANCVTLTTKPTIYMVNGVTYTNEEEAKAAAKAIEDAKFTEFVLENGIMVAQFEAKEKSNLAGAIVGGSLALIILIIVGTYLLVKAGKFGMNFFTKACCAVVKGCFAACKGVYKAGQAIAHIFKK